MLAGHDNRSYTDKKDYSYGTSTASYTPSNVHGSSGRRRSAGRQNDSEKHGDYGLEGVSYLVGRNISTNLRIVSHRLNFARICSGMCLKTNITIRQ